MLPGDFSLSLPGTMVRSLVSLCRYFVSGTPCVPGSGAKIYPPLKRWNDPPAKKKRLRISVHSTTLPTYLWSNLGKVDFL